MTQHAIDRANERYGILLDVSLVREQIRSNKAKMLERVSKQKAIYQVDHHYTKLFVLYHRQQQAVITVLPATHFSSRTDAFKELHWQDELRAKNLAAMEAFNRARAKDKNHDSLLQLKCEYKQTICHRFINFLHRIIKK